MAEAQKIEMSIVHGLVDTLYLEPHVSTQETWQQTVITLMKSHVLFQVKLLMDFTFRIQTM